MPWLPLHESGIPFDFNPDTDGLVTISGSTITSIGSADDYSGWELQFDLGSEYSLRLTPVEWNFPNAGAIYHEIFWYAPPTGDFTFVENEAADPESDFQPAPVEATLADTDASISFYLDDVTPGLNVKWLVEIETPCFWRPPVGASQICIEGEAPVSNTAELISDFSSGTDWTYFSSTYYVVWDTDPEAFLPYEPVEPVYGPELEIDMLDLPETYNILGVNNCGNAVSASHTPGSFLGTTAPYNTGICEPTSHSHVLAEVLEPTWPIGAPAPDVVLSAYPRFDFDGAFTTTGFSGFKYLRIEFAFGEFGFDPVFGNSAQAATVGSSSNGTIGSSPVNFGADYPRLLPMDGIRFGIQFGKSAASGTVDFEFTRATIRVPDPAFHEATVLMDEYWPFPPGGGPGYDTNDYSFPTDTPLPSTEEVRIMHYRKAAIPFGSADFRYYQGDVEALADGIYRGRLVLIADPSTTIATVKVVRGVAP